MSRSVGVIGAGVIGAMCARFLDDAGAAVTVYDPGAGRAQSTWAAAGLLGHEDDGQPSAWHALARRGLALWPEIGLRYEQMEYRRVGMLLLGRDDRWLAWREANGYTAELAEWRDQPALLMPEVSAVRPPRVAPALLDGVACRAKRVDAVDEVLAEHDIALIAAGTWSQPLLNDAGVPVDVGPRRGQMMVFDRGDLPHVVRTTTRQVALPRADGRIAVGVTWEDVGFDTTPTTPRSTSSRHGRASRSPAWDTARPHGRDYAPGQTATSPRSDGPTTA